MSLALIENLRSALSPPHPAGRPFIIGGVLLALVGLFIAWPVWVLGLAFAVFCLYFFRDPERVPPPRPNAVLAPADGRIVSVALVPPPAALGLGDAPVWRVATFLSVLNVHVNRLPVAGTVTAVAYSHGKFLNASLDKASDDNERNGVAIRLADGRGVGVVQIAGLVARRIVCTVRQGEAVRAGERFGIIRFGSRTDLYLPPGVEPVVAVGQTMVGGETVMAELHP